MIEYRYPEYYGEFSCIADACPDTCCRGWEIVIDKRSLSSYGRVGGPYGKVLRKNIRKTLDQDHVFRLQKDGSCAFLNKDGLCNMYSKLGKDSLCKTCKRYPRHVEEFEGVKEITLSLSCPEACRMVLEKKKPVKFLTKLCRGEEEYEDFDFLLYDKLLYTRDAMISILQDRNLSILFRMQLVLALGRDVQKQMAKDNIFAIDGVVDRYRSRETARRFRKELDRRLQSHKGTLDLDRFETALDLFQLLSQMEMINKKYKHRVGEIKESLGRLGVSDFSKDLFDSLEGNLHDGKMAIWLEQLMVYFIYTYYCGGVYDQRALAKVKFAVISTMMIWMDGICMHPKDLDLSAMILETYTFCREMEHSDINLKRFDRLSGQEAYRAERLILSLSF